MASAASHAPATRFIDPTVLAGIGNLELVARSVVEGFISGLHRSPRLGMSLDFAEYRPYQPGDDIRRIDWRVYARSDRLYVKEYEADTNADVCFMLDVSRSMDYAGGELAGSAVSKLDYARMVAASLGYLSQRQRDRIGLIAFGAEVVEYIPPSARYFDRLLQTLERLKPAPASGGDLLQGLARCAELAPRRGIRVLLSDCYAEPSELAKTLDELRLRGHDVIVFHLLTPTEREFPFAAATPFRDMESGQQLPVRPEAIRDDYRRLLNEHSAELHRKLGESRIDYALFDTGQALDHVLFRYLNERQRLIRVR